MGNPNDITNQQVRQLYIRADNQLKALEAHYNSAEYKQALLSSHDQHSGADFKGKLTHIFAPARYSAQAQQSASHKIQRIKTSIEAVRRSIFEQLQQLDQAIEQNPLGLEHLLKVMALSNNNPAYESDPSASLKQDFSEEVLEALRKNIPTSANELTDLTLQELIDLCEGGAIRASSRILLNGLGEGMISRIGEFINQHERESFTFVKSPEWSEFLRRQSLAMSACLKDGITEQVIGLLDDDSYIVSMKVLQARYNVEPGSVGTLVLSNPDQSQTADFIRLLKTLNKATMTIEDSQVTLEFDSSVSVPEQEGAKKLLLGISGLDAEKIILKQEPPKLKTDFF